MIRSSASLMAEDVTVRCRVKRIAQGSRPGCDNGQEMTCTMRNWEQSNKRSRSRPRGFLPSSISPATAKSNGPELLLTPVPEYSTNRDDSPAPRFRRKNQVAAEQSPRESEIIQFSIPIDDILLIHTSPPTRLDITTTSMGNYEFSHLTLNSHDILLAFLQASLAPERIIKDYGKGDDKCCTTGIESSSSITTCLDIDALQAKHVQGSVAAETWHQKMGRRVGHVLNNLQELSEAFCDAACCREERRDGVPQSDGVQTSRSQQPQFSNRRHRNSQLEIDDAETATTSPTKASDPSLIATPDNTIAAR